MDPRPAPNVLHDLHGLEAAIGDQSHACREGTEIDAVDELGAVGIRLRRRHLEADEVYRIASLRRQHLERDRWLIRDRNDVDIHRGMIFAAVSVGHAIKESIVHASGICI